MSITSGFLCAVLLATLHGRPAQGAFVSVDSNNNWNPPPPPVLISSSKTVLDCPFECKNGGTCVPKMSPPTELELEPRGHELEDEWMCQCPFEFGGNLCQFRRHRNLDDIVCGSLTCKNGGKCAENHDYVNEHDYNKPVCDCSSAVEVLGDAPPFTVKQYVGRECEIEVTDYCAGNKDLFCVNMGICRLKAQNFVQEPCKCEDGFTGRHCEFEDEHVAETCFLDCNNVGQCQHGLNPDAEIGDVGGSINFMHCSCDEGYAGTNCEFSKLQCGGRNRFCYHNSTCVGEGTESGRPECQCEYDFQQGVQVTGKFCEFRASDNCKNPELITTAQNFFDEANKLTDAEFPFCANNGECYQLTDTEGNDLDEYYCQCANTGYEGRRCQDEIAPAPAPGESPQPSATYTDTWPPTEEGSVTDWPTTTASPTTTSPTTISPTTISPTESPTKKPTTAPTIPVHLKASTNDDEGKLKAGGKLGIILLVFGTIGVAVIIIVYFQSRARYLNSLVYQDNNGGNSGAFVWDKPDYNGTSEQALEMTPTASQSADSYDQTPPPRNLPPPPPTPSSLDVDVKDLANVEIV